MLEIEDRGANPGPSPAHRLFGGLAPGDKVRVHPSIPRPSGDREYRVQQVETGRVVLRERPADPPLNIAAGAVARFQAAHGQQAAQLVLKGRLQWITAERQWAVLPEEPPLDCEHGLHKLASASDPAVVEFIEKLRRQGYSPWWVPVGDVHDFLGQGGEIIYDQDGRYLRTRDHRSEWILLGRNPGATAQLP